MDSVEPEADIMKAPGSKFRTVVPDRTVAPPSSVLKELVSVSAPQENLPLVASQRSLDVAAVSQSVRPDPLTPPFKEVDPVTVKALRACRPLVISREPAKELEPVLVVETMVRSSAVSLSAQGLVVLTQLPVMVSASDREAGPPAPQSSRTMDSVVPEAVREKAPGSKFRTVVPDRTVAPPSSVLKELVSVSAPQENLPLVASHRSLDVAAVSQSVRPDPLTPRSEERRVGKERRSRG